MMRAPVAITERLTTPLIEARPTFWLNEVMGVHPKRPAIELTKPSQAMLPPSSLSVGWRLRAPAQRALVSPIVSVALTR